jgi:membrane protein DedA with SNARE-associated domain
MSNLAQATIAFVQDHSGWAPPIVFVLAFCASFAFISLVVPATVILFAVGGMIGASGIELGATACRGSRRGRGCDWLAYDLALRFRGKITHSWLLARDPALLARGVVFFKRWGMLAVIVGRFFGPLRAAVPIVAGLCGTVA